MSTVLIRVPVKIFGGQTRDAGAGAGAGARAVALCLRCSHKGPAILAVAWCASPGARRHLNTELEASVTTLNHHIQPRRLRPFVAAIDPMEVHDAMLAVCFTGTKRGDEPPATRFAPGVSCPAPCRAC